MNRWEINRRHWSTTLDAQNLAERSNTLALETQLRLYHTADVREALDLLDPAARLVLDLGGGLGLMAIHLARRGAFVVIADISLPRLREARNLARQLGLADRIATVHCFAENLPFLDASIDRQTCKSVLIHTDLARASSELARTLSPDGRAVFIEPLAHNPFVNAYRRLAAPRVWREITDYFTPSRLTQLRHPFRQAGFQSRAKSLYFLAFLATPLNYTLHLPALYRFAETFLLFLDAILFAVLPPLKRLAWFALILVEGRHEPNRTHPR